jgi:prophage antirepressor-like protein
MNNQIIPFDFENRSIRTVVRDQVPWWVGKDVCEVLGIQNVSQALSTKRIDPKGREYVNFPENEKADIPLMYISSNGTQQARKTLCVNEPGLYRLIFKSHKPEAERFKTWVFNEALPQIRRAGMLPEEVKEVIARLPISDCLPAIEFALRQDYCSTNTIWLVRGVVEMMLDYIAVCQSTDQLREENKRLNRRYICTPDDVQEILQLHKAGFKVLQIAYKTKKGRTRIKKVVAEAVSQPCLFDDEPSESFGGPLEAPRGHDGGGV